MIFNTDIVLAVQKGIKVAAALIDDAQERYLSTISYMELIRLAKDSEQVKMMKDFLKECDFIILPFTVNIGHRASIYMEEYSLTNDLRAGDAIVAATATENNLMLVTGDGGRFSRFQNLSLQEVDLERK